jgi:hypothetical protein
MVNDSRDPGGDCLRRGCIHQDLACAANRIRDCAYDAQLGVPKSH